MKYYSNMKIIGQFYYRFHCFLWVLFQLFQQKIWAQIERTSEWARERQTEGERRIQKKLFKIKHTTQTIEEIECKVDHMKRIFEEKLTAAGAVRQIENGTRERDGIERHEVEKPQSKENKSSTKLSLIREDSNMSIINIYPQKFNIHAHSLFLPLIWWAVFISIYTELIIFDSLWAQAKPNE